MKPDLQPDVVLEIGGRGYPLRFGQHAIYLIEQACGKGIDSFDTMPRFSLYYCMLYAGLECARLKYQTRPQPWTLFEASELADAAGGVLALSAKILEAWLQAFPQMRAPIVDGAGKAIEKKTETGTTEIGASASATPSSGD